MVLHLVVPVVIAWLLFRPIFKKAALLMLAGNLLDLDHLLANPIIDPNRCSVGYHMLHQYWLIPLYVFLAVFSKTRLIGIGLVVHIILDYTDCL
ncbi:DUF6122 family protein [Rufibacter immobilis]|uniref:DUF6122 family protein n=1 Tax=Rufibacter immobilis TaxID=1348778 RepID=UPI0035E5734F